MGVLVSESTSIGVAVVQGVGRTAGVAVEDGKVGFAVGTSVSTDGNVRAGAQETTASDKARSKAEVFMCIYCAPLSRDLGADMAQSLAYLCWLVASCLSTSQIKPIRGSGLHHPIHRGEVSVSCLDIPFREFQIALQDLQVLVTYKLLP